jgi:tungstate transport system substrate-binding protein
MYNDFVLVGPDDDPARASGAGTVSDAVRRIAASATFLSRGDESGTHQRERELWRLAGATPPAARLPTSGQGMGATLRQASATGAYTLSDRATFVALEGRLEMRVVFEGGVELLNTYAVIVPQTEGRAGGRARNFAEWIAGTEAQRLIADFKTGSAPPPFQPWPAGAPAGAPEDTPVPRR